jgi:uncharacterized protein DUF222
VSAVVAWPGRDALDEALEVVEDGLALLGGLDLDGYEAGRLEGASARTRRQARTLDGLQVRIIQALDRANRDSSAGVRATEGYLQATTGDSHSQLRRELDTARRLEGLPDTQAALEAGDISMEAAAVIARHAAGRLADVDGVEQVLLGAATRGDARSVDRAAAELQAQVDAELGLSETVRQMRRRRLRMWTDEEGMFALDARLDTLGGSAVKTMLEALLTTDPADTPEEARRSFEQRQADALADAAHLFLGLGELPDVATVRPQLRVVVDEAVLTGADDAGLGTLDTGETIAADTVGRIACIADLVVVRRNGTTLLSVEVAGRFASKAQLHALAVRDGGCRFQGCPRPPIHCEAHHVVFYEHGGPTVLTNLVLICRFHHHLLHEGRWKLTMDPDGTCHFTDRSGRQYTTGPPR